MADLSPSAQAVLDAVREICPAPADEIAAAAIKTAADVIDFDPWLKEHADYCAELRVIAAELEGSND